MQSTVFECAIAGFPRGVLNRLLAGGMSARGILLTAGAGAVNPERLKSLVVYFASFAPSTTSALHAHATAGRLASRPCVPNFLIETSLGSQALFVDGKLRRNPDG